MQLEDEFVYSFKAIFFFLDISKSKQHTSVEKLKDFGRFNGFLDCCVGGSVD